MSKLMKNFGGGMIAVLVLGFAAEVNAQGGFGVSFGKHGRHSSFGVNIGFPVGRSHCAPAPVYCPPVHRHSECCKSWTPGRFETHCEQVWVPGACRQVWIEPVYCTQYDHCGRPIQVLVSSGHWQTVQDPGHYETVNRQVWIEPTYVLSCGY